MHGRFLLTFHVINANIAYVAPRQIPPNKSDLYHLQIFTFSSVIFCDDTLIHFVMNTQSNTSLPILILI